MEENHEMNLRVGLATMTQHDSTFLVKPLLQGILPFSLATIFPVKTLLMGSLRLLLANTLLAKTFLQGICRFPSPNIFLVKTILQGILRLLSAGFKILLSPVIHHSQLALSKPLMTTEPLSLRGRNRIN